MSKVVEFTRLKTVGLADYADEPIAGNEVRLHTLYSGISAGTELTAYRNSNPYLHKRWDGDRRLFVPSEVPQLQYPIRGWGYEEVGEVVEVGRDIEGVQVGDIIYGAWGHRSHKVIHEDYAKARILPASLEPVLGIFSQIGAIALNGVHDARIRIGDTVAIFGLGVPGQITAQLAKRSGAKVIGVDLMEQRLSLAQKLGAIDLAINANEGSTAERIRDYTNNRGADVAIEASGSTAALNEAIRSVAYSAKVIALGFYQGQAQGLLLGEEFHHNRINVVCSQISGVDPELTYRWNELRLAQTSIRLQEEGALQLKSLITHTYPYEDAAEAFGILDKSSPDVLQVVLDFSGT